MELNAILLILGVVFGVAYFAKRNHRRQSEMKSQSKRGRM
jgi:hypothetical protein